MMDGSMLDEARREIRQAQDRVGPSPSRPGRHSVSAGELVAAALTDARSNSHYFEWDERTQVYHVYWGGYDYEVDYERITRPEHIIGVMRHLSDKSWELMTTRRLTLLAESIARRRGWDIWG